MTTQGCWRIRVLAHHRVLAHRASVHRVLAQRFLAHRVAHQVLAHRVLAHRVLAHRVLAHRVLARRVLAHRVLAHRGWAGRDGATSIPMLIPIPRRVAIWSRAGASYRRSNRQQAAIALVLPFLEHCGALQWRRSVDGRGNNLRQ